MNNAWVVISESPDHSGVADVLRIYATEEGAKNDVAMIEKVSPMRVLSIHQVPIEQDWRLEFMV